MSGNNLGVGKAPGGEPEISAAGKLHRIDEESTTCIAKCNPGDWVIPIRFPHAHGKASLGIPRQVQRITPKGYCAACGIELPGPVAIYTRPIRWPTGEVISLGAPVSWLAKLDPEGPEPVSLIRRGGEA